MSDTDLTLFSLIFSLGFMFGLWVEQRITRAVIKQILETKRPALGGPESHKEA